jgi:hypothetical protein
MHHHRDRNPSRVSALRGQRDAAGSRASEPLDATDWAIIRELQRDARLSFNQVAKLVNPLGAVGQRGGGRPRRP